MAGGYGTVTRRAAVAEFFKTKSVKDVGAKPTTGKFTRGEEGSTMVLGLFVFVVMLAAGGMAVDFMQAERERAQIQYTLDRAILAGAALSQPLVPKDVVEDYFQKSGLDNYNLSVSTPEESNTLTSRRVEAHATSNVNNYFVNMVGIGDMLVSAEGAAEERVQNVEISMVLDVSGSMGSSSKMTNMKTAALEFVETVLTTDNINRVSINLVPYNMQVNAGEALLDALDADFNVTNEHDNSHCLDFTSTQFQSSAISSGTTYQRTGHFDPFYTSINHPATSSDDNNTRLFMCPTTDYSEITLLSQNLSDLQDKINALQPGGNTSIDIGVRWGSTLLDPSVNSVLDELSGDDAVDAVFSDRPAAYDDSDSIKIMIVMTDGINTTQYTLDDDYDSGDSNVWVTEDSTIMSIYDDYNNEYFVTNTYNDNYYGNSNVYGDLNGSGYRWTEGGEYEKWANSPHEFHGTVSNGFPTGDVRRLTWPEVWDMMGTRYNAYYNQYRMRNWGSEYYDWRDKVTNSIGGSTKDSRLSNACDAAKDNGVVIFSIGFEVTTSSAAVMEDCASSESHFYRVEGIEISDAFNAIAQTIQRLKLTN
jgi:Flp pilus assembly protein TadG